MGESGDSNCEPPTDNLCGLPPRSCLSPVNGMVSGVYLRETDNAVKVKVICIITQDVTGGFRQSYAVNIANRIGRIANTKK